jgi:Flp pilus assembly protein TadG
MRRMNSESGATAVLMAIMLVPLLGIGALVIDVGMVYFEARQLQNGADAAALAVAADCAAGDCGASDATAGFYTDGNAADGLADATVQIPGLNGPNSVTVTASTRSQDGSDRITYYLASLLESRFNSDYNATFQRTATASWGGVGGGSTVPLTFSYCEWQNFTGGLGIDALPTPVMTVYHHTSSASDVNDCDGPAGQDYPGGFGWLDTNGDGTCTADVILGNADGDTGNSPPVPAASTGCTSAFFAGLIGQTVLMPVFGEVTGVGSNAVYEILGFAALEVTGFRFGGSLAGGSPVPCGNPERCISGRFVEYYDLGSEPTVGAPDYGAYFIGLTG